MRNGWYEGTRPGNRNVPEGDVHIYGSLVTMSGEVVTTYFAQRHHPEYGKWSIWKVVAWIGEKPQPATYGEVERLRKKKAHREVL